MREIGDMEGMERKLLIFFGAVGLLVVLGPFGTYDSFHFWDRIVYWFSIMIGVGFFMTVIVQVCLQSPLLGKAGLFARIAMGTFLAGLPGSVVVIFVDNLFRDAPLAGEELPQLWIQVSAVGFAICLVEFVDWNQKSSAKPAHRQVKFYDRLAPDFGEIQSLSMQDHYVEVTGTSGKEMVLIRLSDAIAELEGLEGTQTHRSHWVAQNAIKDVQRSGQKTCVTLKDGRRLPVSATYADQVRAIAPQAEG